MTEHQYFNLAVWAWNRGRAAGREFDLSERNAFYAGAFFWDMYGKVSWIRRRVCEL